MPPQKAIAQLLCQGFIMETMHFWTNYWEVITILCMGITTYFTRTVGFVWLRKHQISPRAQAVLASSPCCVMVSVVAPSFMTTDPKTLIALAFCILLSCDVLPHLRAKALRGGGFFYSGIYSRGDRPLGYCYIYPILEASCSIQLVLQRTLVVAK